MSSDSKQRKKNERRQKRLDKRRRQQAVRDVKLQAVTCANCGERYGVAEEDDVIHRAGPCDCTPAIRKAMDDFLDARSEAYESAPGKKIACRTCGTMHGEDKQSTHFFEGRLVWDGCDHCYEAQVAKFESIREEHRERWFGPRPKPFVSQTTPVSTTIAATPSKYVPPPIRSEPIATSIYTSSFARP